MPAEVINGCARSMATEITDNSYGMEWKLGHDSCTRVKTGAFVSWTGLFSLYPLIGGTVEGDTVVKDADSPITMLMQVDGMSTGHVFDVKGTYPYTCEVTAEAFNACDPATQKCVLYVEDPSSQ